MLWQKVYFDVVLDNLVGYFGKKMKTNNKCFQVFFLLKTSGIFNYMEQRHRQRHRNIEFTHSSMVMIWVCAKKRWPKLHLPSWDDALFKCLAQETVLIITCGYMGLPSQICKVLWIFTTLYGKLKKIVMKNIHVVEKVRWHLMGCWQQTDKPLTG